MLELRRRHRDRQRYPIRPFDLDLHPDVNRAFPAMRDLEAGITYINAPTIGAEVHLPFGGVKQTGNGHREGGNTLSISIRLESVYVDYSDKLQRAQIDTGNRANARLAPEQTDSPALC